MEIKEARFVISNTDVTKCPADDRPEYAFIGRSNVGKSSLINMLTGRKGLAMTSSTPGKTLLINHFDIDGTWYIVDLPGYGYARRGKEGRENIRRIIERYVLGRESMTCLFVLIDSRHEPQKIDLEFMTWLGENGVPFAIVFTKADKLGTTVLRDKIEAYKTRLLEEWEELPPIFITSSETRKGRDELLDYIGSLNEMIKNAPSGADSPEGEET
ncbi:MAG TPA: YihA family ribosome biogenesis GTP-binding protein [Candidatus Caccoplasma merdavium]|nr:YihA family ribosome biogenesis GTP-binding protein [Candidatus Caccoplasma merdavium]